MLDIDNSDGQSANAFKKGQYALANVLFYPVKNVMFGPEIQWGRRENNTTASPRTTSASSSRPSTTSAHVGRQVDE